MKDEENNRVDDIINYISDETKRIGIAISEDQICAVMASYHSFVLLESEEKINKSSGEIFAFWVWFIFLLEVVVIFFVLSKTLRLKRVI